MNWSTWKKRLGLETRAHTARFVAPNLVLDLEPGFVAAARLHPSRRLVQSVAVRDLANGSLIPSANKANVADGASVRRTINEISELVGNPGGRLGLLVSDLAARVALLQFETLPPSPHEAETMVLWKMREFLPYAPEEAHLSYQVLLNQPGAVEVLGVAIRGTVLAEYESLVEGLNGGPELVLPASVALLPLLPEGPEGQLLLHLSPGVLTVAVVESNRVRYWRTRALEAEGPGRLDEVAREASRVLATCQDNLAVQIEKVWVCTRPPAEREMHEVLTKALGREYSSLGADIQPAAGLPPGQRTTYVQYGIPFAGLVANLS
jgi:hypothetical protein